MHVEESGAGRPLVLLHGFGATVFTWRFVAAPLAVSHRVFRLDLLGFGSSPKPPDGPYSIRSQATRLEEFLRSRQLRDVTLVGHSLGGSVSLLTALQLKGSGIIRSLVLIDAPAYPQRLPLFITALRSPLGPFLTRILPASEQVRAVLKLAYWDNGQVPADAIRVYAQALGSPGARGALVQTARELIPPDLDQISNDYPSLSTPTLLIWGKHDRIVPLSVGQRLARALPRASLVVIDRAGHLPQEERSEETADQLARFIE